MARDGRDEIIARWRAAKQADPKLTRGDFMMKGSPGRYKNKESAAAYLRVLEASGRKDTPEKRRRSGDVLWKRSTQTLPGGERDLYQVAVKDKSGNTRSFDLEVVGGGSSFDVALVEHRLKEDRKALRQKRDAWARRYDIDAGDLDVDNIQVRRVKRVTKHALRIALKAAV